MFAPSPKMREQMPVGSLSLSNVETNPTTPYRVASLTVDVQDGNVTLEVGQQDEYTMLNWMSIEPAP